VQVDGQDVAAVHRAAAQGAALARSGGGPTFIEALTYRHLGHDIGERGQYRTADEVSWWERHRDPVQRLRAALVARGDLDDDGYEQAAGRARARVAEAVSAAEAAPLPDPATVTDGVTATELRIRTGS
jgi:pyruvate dehydrogenase E1 component alpha subunit